MCETYIVKDVEVGCQGITSSHGSTIVGDMDCIVECVKIDAINN